MRGVGMRFLNLVGPLLLAAVAVGPLQVAEAQAAQLQGAQAQKAPPDMTEVITVDAPVFVLNHVRVVDGTGAAAKDDQSVVVANGKIRAIGAAGSVAVPQDAVQFDKTGYTVIPGLVGMHDPLYYTDSIAVQRAGGRIPEPGLR